MKKCTFHEKFDDIEVTRVEIKTGSGWELAQDPTIVKCGIQGCEADVSIHLSPK